ncbi:hypothetical protein Tco_0690418 [Tanacetum coccineum]
MSGSVVAAVVVVDGSDGGGGGGDGGGGWRWWLWWVAEVEVTRSQGECGGGVQRLRGTSLAGYMVFILLPLPLFMPNGMNRRVEDKALVCILFEMDTLNRATGITRFSQFSLLKMLYKLNHHLLPFLLANHATNSSRMVAVKAIRNGMHDIVDDQLLDSVNGDSVQLRLQIVVTVRRGSDDDVFVATRSMLLISYNKGFISHIALPPKKTCSEFSEMASEDNTFRSEASSQTVLELLSQLTETWKKREEDLLQKATDLEYKLKKKNEDYEVLIHSDLRHKEELEV